MSEQKIPIPARLYNAAVGGHICGTEDIIDDAKGKNQSQINTEVDNAIQNEIERATQAENNRYTKSEVYKKEETYNKNELNNLITTPSQEYVTVVATSQTTSITDVLPATGTADTVYRVGNWDGSAYDDTVYSEYAWNGTAYVFLRKKDYGIDDEPTAGSNNLVKSGGVYEEVSQLGQEIENDLIGVSPYSLIQGYIDSDTEKFVKDETSNYCVNRFFIPVIAGHIIKFNAGAVVTERKYCFVYDENYNYADSFYQQGTKERTIVLSNNASAFLRFHVVWGEIGYVFDVTDNKMLWQSNIPIGKAITDLQFGLDNLEKFVHEQLFGEYKPLIGDGTFNNSGNEYGVRNDSLIPASVGMSFKVNLNKTLQQGHYLKYSFCESDITNTFTDLKTHRLVIEEGSLSNLYTITNPDCVSLCVYFMEYDENDQRIALRADDFGENPIIVKSVINDSVYSKVVKNEKDIKELQHIDAYVRNKGKIVALGAACRERKFSDTSKDFQMLIVTDSHDDNIAVKNASVMTNGFATISAMIHCGDMAGDYLTPDDNMTDFIAAISLCNKNWYNVIGNHEAGTYNCVGFVPSQQHMYNVLIKPLVDNGFLSVGEYSNGKCYYYHDFTQHNIRLIVVNEYDGDLAFDTTNWEAVAYDASANEFTFGSTYQIGDIVKMPHEYDEYCFKAKQNVTVGSRIYNLNGNEPRYIVRPGERMLSQAQAQWFLDTLASTPANYSVVVAMHNPFSDIAQTQPLLKFNQTSINDIGANFSQNLIQNDFFAEAIDAFVNGTTYSPKIVFKSAAAYRNVLNDGSIDYAYQVSKDFSSKNTGVQFMCYLGGHTHKDLIWRHPTYQYQWQVNPICATVGWHQSPRGDIRRSASDGLDYDSITTVSFDTDTKILRLVKIGVDVTDEMEYRDFEKIYLT